MNRPLLYVNRLNQNNKSLMEQLDLSKYAVECVKSYKDEELSIMFKTSLCIATTALLLFACGESGEVGVNEDSSSSTSAVEATDACFASCMERPGATEERCAEACARIGGTTCEEGCIARGGDEADCEAICAQRDSAGSCYEGCIERGGDEETCREACSERERLDSDADGDIQSAYEECIEAGGTPEDCRERAAAANDNE